MNLTPVPLESDQPIASFGWLRLAVVLTALLAELVFDVPHMGRLLVVTAAVALPWALLILLVGRRTPRTALSPLVALVDLIILAAAELVVPDSYVAIRCLAIFAIAAHAHFQGELRGVLLAVIAIALLVPIGFATDGPITDNGLLAFYEVLFAASALAAGRFVGRLRTAESTGRLRARELSRRVIEAEGEVRRRVAEAIHDGPVQELVSLDMVLTAARLAIERGELDRASEMIDEARATAERNVTAMREEIVSLGPYALEELTLDAAIDQCAPIWSRRYGVPVELSLERIDLPNDICGALFGIAQEAVVNAGRHAEAAHIWVTLKRVPEGIELTVRDDGKGFRDRAPMPSDEPGHIGIATMRERAELIGGTLTIETGEEGSSVVARVPIPHEEAAPPGDLGEADPSRLR